MLMDSCQKVTEQASRYIERDLPFFKRIKMQLHLLMCNNCRLFLEQFDLTIKSLKKLRPVYKYEISDKEIDEQIINLMKQNK